MAATDPLSIEEAYQAVFEFSALAARSPQY
jgi:hypothetical protein